MSFFCKVFLMVILLISCISLHASADFVIDVESTINKSNDSYLYLFTVNNPITNNDDSDPDLLIVFNLDIPSGAALSNLVTPNGWEHNYYPGSTSITWSATDFPFTLAPGGSLQFGATSPLAPGSISYAVQVLNELNSGGNIDASFGTTLGPAMQSVPEPSSIISYVTGLITISGYTWYGRRKAAR